MTALRNKISAALLLAACATATAGAEVSSVLKVYDIGVGVDENARTLSVDVELFMKDMKLGRDREVTFTPIVISTSGTDSLELEPITICGRNRYYYYMRKGVLDSGDAFIYRAGSPRHAVASQTVPFLPWMGHSTVEMREETSNCCSRPDPVDGGSVHGYTELARINTERPPVAEGYVFAPPVDAGPVEKNIEGSAFITFVVNRTELKPDYMINRQELAKIINSIDYVRNDPDATITHVHIKGFASPEGPWKNNVRLATGRTETLRRYVRDLYHFDDSTITSSFEPEDWQGLRNYVTDSMQIHLDNREGLLSIIDSNLEPDEKDHTLRRRYPSDYKTILADIYPWLRHSDYRVSYRIKVYTSLEEIRRVYGEDPTRLRNVDFYTLAQSYPQGSPEYIDVMETAVEVYPDDPNLNLNAANLDFARGDLDAAQSHLLKAGNTPEATFARGVLAAKRADYFEAERYFLKARDLGIEGADNYLESIRAIREYHPVTITVETTKDK